MGRLVRDASIKLGKDIKLLTEGEETEIDRKIVEDIGDPLMHMIRNAVDHGIESWEERLKRGKSDQGTIHMRAFNQ